MSKSCLALQFAGSVKSCTQPAGEFLDAALGLMVKREGGNCRWWLSTRLRALFHFSPYFALLILGWTLRLWGLDNLGLWLDEVYTVYPAQLPMRQLLHFVASLEHPPLYFLLLHFWIRIAGSSTFAMRYLSVFPGVLGIVGLYLLARRLWSRRVAVLAALLLTVSPIHIWYSRDIRMYEPLFVCALFSSYFLVRGLKDAEGDKSDGGSFLSRNRFWIGYVFVALIGLYTLNVAAFVELAHVLIAVIVFLTRPRARRRVRKFVISLIIVCIGYLPWLPVFLVQAEHVNQYFWISRPTWTTLRGTFLNFYSGFLFSNSPWHPKLGHWPANLLYMPLLVLLFLGIWNGRKAPFALMTSLALWLVPMGVIYELSQIRPAYLDRTVLPASAGLLILWATGATEARGNLARCVGILGVCVMLIANCFSLYNLHARGEKEEWNRAAAIVAQSFEPGDLVLVDSGLSQIAFDYYFDKYDGVSDSYGFPLDNDHWRTQQIALNSRWWILDFMEFNWTSAEARLEHLIRDADRLWLVVNRPLGDERLQDWMSQRFDDRFVYEVNRVRVLLYTNSNIDGRD